MARTAEHDCDSTTRGLRILVADQHDETLRATERLLADLGHTVTARAVSVDGASESVAADDPDLTVVVVDGDLMHALALVREMSEFARGPVILLLNDGDASEFVSRAAEHGIYAFARQRFAEEVQGAIELAMRRHAEQRRLTEQVDQLESALERRGAIERAKGILMERHGVGSDDAFELLRGQARRSNRRVVDLARAVSEGRSLLPRSDDAPD